MDKTNIAMLEQIANDSGSLNGVELMMRNNERASSMLVTTVELAIDRMGASTEYILSEMAGNLKHDSHTYRDFVKSERDAVMFYDELNRFLQEKYNNLMKFMHEKEGKRGEIRPIGSTLEALNLLKLSIGLKDSYTGAHMRRVKSYCDKLADYFKIPTSEKFIMLSAAADHDDGKLVVPYNILNKSGKLTGEEKTIMDRHSLAGKEILNHLLPYELEGRKQILNFVETHHKPAHELNQNDQLMHGIIVLSDAFDAMTTDRPYRKALSYDKVEDELKKNIISQFHPDVVKAVLKGVIHPSLN